MTLAQKAAEKLKPEQAGLVKMLAAKLEAKNGKAKESLDLLRTARSNLSPPSTPERQLAQIEIAENMAELVGTPPEAKQGTRLEWDKGKEKVNSDVNSILKKL